MNSSIDYTVQGDPKLARVCSYSKRPTLLKIDMSKGTMLLISRRLSSERANKSSSQWTLCEFQIPLCILMGSSSIDHVGQGESRIKIGMRYL